MKRLLACAVLVGLLLPGVALGQDETAFDYDGYVVTIHKMAELLDQAIYLAAAGMNPYVRQGTSLHLYGQGIVNLIQGPDSPNYDPTSEFTVDEGSGLQPLLFSLEAVAGQAVGEISEEQAVGLAEALRAIGQFLGLAGEAAVLAASRPAITFVDPDDLRTIYAYLLAARGGPQELFLIGGVQMLVELFPSRTVWVRLGDSIQAAIDQVPEGGTIYLEPGSHLEPLSISKSVNLSGYSPDPRPGLGTTMIQGVPWKVGINVQSETPISVTIRDLEIYDGAAGISVGGMASLRLEDVVIRDCEWGITARGSAALASIGCEFRDTQSGMGVQEHASLACDGSRFVRCGRALWIRTDAPSSIRDCRIVDSASEDGGAIDLGGSACLEMADCEVVDGKGSGIIVFEAADLHLTGCTIAGNVRQGITAYSEECNVHGWGIPPDGSAFTGTITGWGNTIPGPDEENGNLGGAICPTEYEFLLDDRAPDDAD